MFFAARYPYSSSLSSFMMNSVWFVVELKAVRVPNVFMRGYRPLAAYLVETVDGWIQRFDLNGALDRTEYYDSKLCQGD